MVCGKAKKIHKEDLRSEIIWWVTVNLITVRSKLLPCICQLTVVVFLCHFVPSPHFYNYYWLLFSVRKNEQLEIPILDKSNWRTMSQVNPSPFFKSFFYPHVINNISGIFQSTQPSGPMNWQKYSLVSYHRSSIHLAPKPQAHSHSSFPFSWHSLSCKRPTWCYGLNSSTLVLKTDVHSKSFHAHYALNIYLAANCLQGKDSGEDAWGLSQHFPLPIFLSTQYWGILRGLC